MIAPTDWHILAVALMRRFDNRVELSWDEVVEARALLDPVENETLLISYQPLFLLDSGIVELRTRPRTVAGVPDALVDELCCPGPKNGGALDERATPRTT
jgi:hypothetical protein